MGSPLKAPADPDRRPPSLTPAWVELTWGGSLSQGRLEITGNPISQRYRRNGCVSASR